MEITLTWRELLVAVALASIIYLAGYLLSNRRRRDSPHLNSAISDHLSRLSEELVLLEKRVEQLESDRIQEHGSKEPENRSVYDYAVQYAKEGLLPEEIVGRCGISLSEATLIVTMQKRGK